MLLSPTVGKLLDCSVDAERFESISPRATQITNENVPVTYGRAKSVAMFGSGNEYPFAGFHW